MKELVLMCGPSGSGKSTYIEQHFNHGEAIVISRDEIRFEMIKPDEDYFAHEKEVLREFYRQIKAACESDFEIVVVDATNLTPKTRAKVLRYASGRRKIAIGFSFTYPTLLEHNKKRSGLAKVPSYAISQQVQAYQFPSIKEGFDTIYHAGGEPLK